MNQIHEWERLNVGSLQTGDKRVIVWLIQYIIDLDFLGIFFNNDRRTSWLLFTHF